MSKMTSSVRLALLVVLLGACGRFASEDTPTGEGPDASSDGAVAADAADGSSPPDATVGPDSFCAKSMHLFCDDFESSGLPSAIAPWSSVKRAGGGELTVVDGAPCETRRCLKASVSALAGDALLSLSLAARPSVCRFRAKLEPPGSNTGAALLVLTGSSASAQVTATSATLSLSGSAPSATVQLGPTPSGWFEIVVELLGKATTVQVGIVGGTPGGVSPSFDAGVTLDVGLRTSTTEPWTVYLDNFYCDAR